MSKEKLSEKIWEQSSGWIEQVGTVIGDLAKQLGVATEHVYTVYTKQIFFEGVVYASVSAFFILILILANIICWFTTRNYKDEVDKWIPRVICAVVLLLIGSLIAFEGLVPNLLKAFNPEYYTIKEIIDQVGGLMKK